MFGVFLQLPPVSKNSHETVAWEEVDVELYYLKTILRQKDTRRVGLSPSIITAINATEISPPKTTTATRSIAREKDFAKPGFKRIHVNVV